MKITIASGLLLLLSLVSLPAKADTYHLDAYGDFFHIQTFTVGFDWDNTAAIIVPATLQFAFTGPLTGWTFTPSGTTQVFDWTNGQGDLFQIDFFNHLDVFPTNVTGIPSDLDLICNSAACNEVFNESTGRHIFFGGQTADSFLSVTPVSAPEPGTISLFTLGLLGLCGLTLRRRVNIRM